MRGHVPSGPMASEKQTGDFGAKLREARERRGLTLRVIADATKISVRALEALERNEIARLPGGIFSRAFVRAYANEVGLDPEQTIAEFMTRFPDEIVTQGHPRTRALVDELENDSRRRPWPLPGRVALVGVPVLVLLSYFGIMGRRAAPVPVQPVSAAAAQGASDADRSGTFQVTIRAIRSTTFSVAPDHLASSLVSLEGNASRTFQARRELLVIPAEPTALEWSADGLPARGLTGPTTITPGTLLGATGGR
jgi:cytoskeleton protein RodZ